MFQYAITEGALNKSGELKKEIGNNLKSQMTPN